MATGATAASVETRRGCMGDTISFAETWRFCKVASRLAKVAYPGLFPGRRVVFADDNAQWTRLWARQRLEHFNSLETNPLLLEAHDCSLILSCYVYPVQVTDAKSLILLMYCCCSTSPAAPKKLHLRQYNMFPVTS
jgi:hypothetical protein